MSESNGSQIFIKEQKDKYGKLLFIEKVIKPDMKGEPDIFAIYKSMPVYAEAKLINTFSYRNLYPFKELQLDTLEERAKSGAMCIGLLYLEKQIRYLMYYDLEEFVDWNKAIPFSWEGLREKWIECLK
jgi:hypothetical protein